MKKTKILTVLLLLLCLSFKAQDARFNLFNATPLHFNPSFAGSLEQNRVSASARTVREGVNATQVFSYDQLVDKAKGGIGLLILNDKFEELSMFSAALIYAPKLLINKKIMLSPSVKLGYGRKNVDWSKLTFGDMIDPRRGFINSTNSIIRRSGPINYFDLSTGVLLNTETLIFGYSIDHINKPDESVIEGTSPLPIKHTLMAGAKLKFSKNSPFSISPNIVYLRQDGFNHFSNILRLKFKKVAIGSAYNTGGAIAIMASYEFKRFRLGYNYEIVTSALTNVSVATHGVSMRYLFNWKKQLKSNTGVLSE